MSLTSSLMLFVTTGMLLGAIAAPRAAGAGNDDRTQLTELSSRSYFFGHQSVGNNLLDGLRLLASESASPLSIVATSDPAQVRKGTFAHAPVGRNGDPAAKVDDFARIMKAGMGDAVDVAFVKFCYVDVGARTDIERLFAHYESVMRELKAAYPNVTFVHFTVPLMTQDTTTKALAKRVLGKANRLADNAKREAYNALVRRAYQGKEPLFDLARAESTGPGGRPEIATWEGKPVPVMVPAYSNDGGHLTRTASKDIARQLVAELVRAKPGP